MPDESQRYCFRVEGMHCKACVLLTEGEIQADSRVKKAVSSLKTHSVEIEGNFGDLSRDQIAKELSLPLEKHGYRLVTGEITRPQVNWVEFQLAIPIALTLAFLFVILQKSGFGNLVDTTSMSFITVFLIGIVASLSTCMAVVGSLVLSLSATYAKEDEHIRPHLLFHVGRLVSFFVLGGVVGALGANFTLSPLAIFILSLLIGSVTLVLGLNLLDVFSWTERFQLTLPQGIAERMLRVSRWQYDLAPFLIGIVTFFLPCGFTQSMQLYALSTGSFMTGAMTMLVFALGTLPVLLLTSLSLFSFQKKSWAGVFFKTAGLLVILFSLFNILSAFTAIGLLPPLFSF